MSRLSNDPVRVRTNLAEYATTRALRAGAVTSPIVDLDFCGPDVAHSGFKAMLQQGAYDAGELAIGTFFQAKIYGKPFVLLPAPVLGRHQHRCVGYNSTFGTLAPKDIEGRKVGVRSYAQTTALWVRGILQHEYGVDLDKVTWMTVVDSHLAEYEDPPNCERLPQGRTLPELLGAGEIDAVILGNDMPDDPNIRTLIPDAAAAGEAWCRRNRIVPVNHAFVVHRDLARTRPDVVAEIYRMLVESNAAAAGDGPPLPFGVEANRKVLELAIEWAFEQKIIPRRLSVDELFDDATATFAP